MDLLKYDLNGSEVERVKLDDSLINLDINMHTVKEYIVSIAHNKRQWSANTKVRSEINCTKKKPRPQKGTGQARQGFLGAPQFKGGFRVFGPRPKFNQHIKINKKERQKVIKYFFSSKISKGDFCFLSIGDLNVPNTKIAFNFLKAINYKDKKILFLGNEKKKDEVSDSLKCFVKSMRNIPKVSFSSIFCASGRDLAICQKIIVIDSAFDDLISLLKR